MFMMMRLGLFFVLTSAILLADEDAIKIDRKVVTTAIRLLDDEQECDPGDIDSLLRDIDPGSPLYSVATQTACYLYVKRQEYSKAWRLMSNESDSIQNESLSLQLGHDRLMLWLLLESGQVEKATGLFKKLVKQLISNGELNRSEKRVLAIFLGKICGMEMADDRPSLLPRDTVVEAISRIEGADLKFVLSAFRSQITETQSQSNELVLIQREVHLLSEQESMSALDEARQDLLSTRAAFLESKGSRETEAKKLRGLRSGFKNQEKVTRYIWYLRYRTEEPGRPSKPTPPSGGKKPTGSRYDKDADKSEWDKYDREQSEYPRKRREYESELQSYPKRLADWEARNQERVKALTIQLEQASTQLAQVKALVDQQRQVFDGAIASKTDNETKFHRAERRVKFLEASIHEKSRGDKKSVHRPSLFSVIDYFAEMARLMSNTRTAVSGQ